MCVCVCVCFIYIIDQGQLPSGDAHDRRRANDMVRMANEAVWAECETHMEREEFARLALQVSDNKQVNHIKFRQH